MGLRFEHKGWIVRSSALDDRQYVAVKGGGRELMRGASVTEVLQQIEDAERDAAITRAVDVMARRTEMWKAECRVAKVDRRAPGHGDPSRLRRTGKERRALPPAPQKVRAEFDRRVGAPDPHPNSAPKRIRIRDRRASPPRVKQYHKFQGRYRGVHWCVGIDNLFHIVDSDFKCYTVSCLKLEIDSLVE